MMQILHPEIRACIKKMMSAKTKEELAALEVELARLSEVHHEDDEIFSCK